MIPRVEAEVFERDLSGGTTRPSVMECKDLDSGERGTYVVKYRKMRGNHCFEFLCITLGRYFGIATLDPALVRLTPELGEALRSIGNDLAQRVLANVGWNFGTRMVEGKTLTVPAAALRGVRGAEAARILAFDVLISNSDRHPARKINLLEDGNRVLILDHELAFGWTIDILGFQSWEEEARKILAGHVFAGKVHGLDEGLGGFTKRLEAMSDGDIDGFFEELPKEFPCHDEDRIKGHLRRARDEHGKFVWAVLEEAR